LWVHRGNSFNSAEFGSKRACFSHFTSVSSIWERRSYGIEARGLRFDLKRFKLIAWFGQRFGRGQTFAVWFDGCACERQGQAHGLIQQPDHD